MATAIANVTLQVTAAPAYIADLAPFATRALSGTYAPANNIVTLSDATPTEWRSQGTSGVAGVVTAWNGGGKSTSGTRLFVHGGGHNDTANNGVYIYDFAGGARPTGWTQPLDISAVSAVRAQQATYTDGRPVAVHTYDGILYAHHNDTIYRFGGAWWSPSGGFTGVCFKYNVATQTWTQLGNYPGGNPGAQTFYDPVTRKIFVFRENAFSGYFFRCDNDTWSGAVSTSHASDYGACAAWDGSRGRGILVGQGSLRTFTINFAAETVTTANITPTGTTTAISAYAPSVVYDSVVDAYWIWGGRAVSSWGSVSRINAATFAMTQHSLSPTIPADANSQGAYSRFALLSAARALGVVSSSTVAPYIIRLPST